MSDQQPGDGAHSGERRDSDRKKLIVDVRFDGGDGTGIANTRDIGVGGLYMTTGAPLEVGNPILMTISVHGSVLKLEGTVVYTDPGKGVGVRFREISDTDLAILKSEMDVH